MHHHRSLTGEIGRTGAPLELSISEDAETVSATVLGADLNAGQRPQGVVPKDAWQAAR